MYKNAIVRKPGQNFCEGQTTANLGKPDYKKALEQHKKYCNALKKAGVSVYILDADLNFPDCTFIQDVAFVSDEVIVLANSGHPSRRGEQELIKTLFPYREIMEIKSPGTMDFGDVERIDDKIFIGQSDRTNKEGAKQLIDILTPLGFSCITVSVKTVLHLSTGMSYVGDNNVLCVKHFTKLPQLKEFNMIEVAEDERYAANCLHVNDYIIVPKGFPKTKKKLIDMGYDIIEIEMSEFEKMDGSLTCLSLLY